MTSFKFDRYQRNDDPSELVFVCCSRCMQLCIRPWIIPLTEMTSNPKHIQMDMQRVLRKGAEEEWGLWGIPMTPYVATIEVPDEASQADHLHRYFLTVTDALLWIVQVELFLGKVDGKINLIGEGWACHRCAFSGHL